MNEASPHTDGGNRPAVAKHVVVRNVDRPSQELVDRIGEMGTATVHEAIGRRGYLGPDITPIQQGVKLAGSAVTVSCHPGDNMMIHAAIEVCHDGDVLVVTNTAPVHPRHVRRSPGHLADVARGCGR